MDWILIVGVYAGTFVSLQNDLFVKYLINDVQRKFDFVYKKLS